MDLTVHRVNDPEKNLLVNQQWEISDPILSCSNQELLLIHFLSNPEVLTMRFRVWDLGLPLCIVPQVYHFPEFVVQCTKHYAIDSRPVFTEKLSQLFIIISREDIIKMLSLHTTNFLEQNIVTLFEEIFTSSTPQVQLSFIQGIQRPKYIISTLEFPIKADACPTTIHQILSMYCQVFGLYHD